MEPRVRVSRCRVVKSFCVIGLSFCIGPLSQYKVYLFTFVYLHFYARAVLHNSTHFITIENKGKIKVVQIYKHTYIHARKQLV